LLGRLWSLDVAHLSAIYSPALVRHSGAVLSL
jgi:hypothetical protein